MSDRTKRAAIGAAFGVGIAVIMFAPMWISRFFGVDTVTAVWIAASVELVVFGLMWIALTDGDKPKATKGEANE